jgi:hypothetical protein
MSTHSSKITRVLERPEVQLLLACASSDIEAVRQAKIRRLVSAGVEWDDVLDRAKRHALLPMLYWQLSASCPELVPKKTLDFLCDHFRKNTARNLVLSSDLLSFLKALKDSGVSAMPYKGPSLAVSVYENVGLRQFGDLDILVRKADVAVATEVLIKEGFKAHFKISEKQLAMFIRLGYVRLLKRDMGRQTVELHWAIAPRFFGFHLDIELLWKSLITVDLLGEQILAPPPEALLLMLCVHGAKDAWERLEWVSGVADLIRRETKLDWDGVFALAEKTHSTRMLKVGLILASFLLGAPVPIRIQSEFESDASLWRFAMTFIAPLTSAEPMTWSAIERVRSQIRFKDDLLQRLRFCFRLGLTTTPVDWAVLPLPKSLRFMYFLVRPVRLLRKYGAHAIRRESSL